VITASIEDEYIGELRKHPRRSRRAGAVFIDDSSLGVEQRLKRGHEHAPRWSQNEAGLAWWQRQRQPGGA